MYKQTLIDQIAEGLKTRSDRILSKGDISAVLDVFGEVVTSALQQGDDVPLPGLGKMAVKAKAARTGRNPKTGETIQIPAKKVPIFTPVKGLRDAIS